jgi:hypothetical protein
VLLPFSSKEVAGVQVDFIPFGAEFRSGGGGLPGCMEVLLELWPENTLRRIFLAGAAL